MRLKLFLLISILTLTNPLSAFSIAEADRNAILKNTIWYDPDAVLVSCQSSGTTLPTTVPEPYHTIFLAAAAKYNTDAVALAVTFYVENGGRWPDPPPPYGTGAAWPVSPAGAKGPFQFVDGTWIGGYDEDANGDGESDVNDLTDASYGAANFLSALGATTGTPLGSIEDPYTEGTLIHAWASYNFGPAAVDRGDPLPNETQLYVQIAFETYLALAGGAAVGGGTVCIGYGGIGISGDFVFPLITTQKLVKEDPEPLVWCWASQTNCHHDYNAADIHVETGTIVIASRPGRVVSRKDTPSQYGSNVTILGDDGFLYYYTHMGLGTIQVQIGDIVAAATPLGRVGTNAQAVGTDRHLHFDMLPPPFTLRPGCSSAECSGLPFINVQPYLTASFANLPVE